MSATDGYRPSRETRVRSAIADARALAVEMRRRQAAASPSGQRLVILVELADQIFNVAALLPEIRSREAAPASASQEGVGDRPSQLDGRALVAGARAVARAVGRSLDSPALARVQIELARLSASAPSAPANSATGSATAGRGRGSGAQRGARTNGGADRGRARSRCAGSRGSEFVIAHGAGNRAGVRKPAPASPAPARAPPPLPRPAFGRRTPRAPIRCRHRGRRRDRGGAGEPFRVLDPADGHRGAQALRWLHAYPGRPTLGRHHCGSNRRRRGDSHGRRAARAGGSGRRRLLRHPRRTAAQLCVRHLLPLGGCRAVRELHGAGDELAGRDAARAPHLRGRRARPRRRIRAVALLPSRRSLPALLSATCASTALYADRVLAAPAGDPPSPALLDAAHRQAGVDNTNLQASFQRVVSEPGGDRERLAASYLAVVMLQRLLSGLNALTQFAPGAPGLTEWQQLREMARRALGDLPSALDSGSRPEAMPGIARECQVISRRLAGARRPPRSTARPGSGADRMANGTGAPSRGGAAGAERAQRSAGALIKKGSRSGPLPSCCLPRPSMWDLAAARRGVVEWAVYWKHTTRFPLCELLRNPAQPWRTLALTTYKS